MATRERAIAVPRGGAVLAFLLAAAVSASAAGAATSPCDLSFPSDSTVAWDCWRLRPGQTLESLFGGSWIDVARFNRIDRRHAWPGVRIRVPRRLEDVAGFAPLPAHHPPADSSERFILVDLGEQYLGAYERGRLVFALPIASGRRGSDTPSGDFRIDAADPRHVSSLYTMTGTGTPYPMHWALRFHCSAGGIGYWIHGRDLPGVPASHGCIGLADEVMQQRYYGVPAVPRLADAQRLYEWVVGPDDGRGFRYLDAGPRVRIVGRAPD